MPEHGDLRRLGVAVRAERVARSWSKESAARFANISSVTWDRIERGLPAQDTKYAAIAKAFGWKPDGCLRIIAGLEPELADEPDTIAAIKADDRLTDDDKARLVDYYERLRTDDDHGQGRRNA